MGNIISIITGNPTTPVRISTTSVRVTSTSTARVTSSSAISTGAGSLTLSTPSSSVRVSSSSAASIISTINSIITPAPNSTVIVSTSVASVSFNSSSILGTGTSAALPSSTALSFPIPSQASSKVLIIAKDDASAFSVYSGLQGYGIPYKLLTVPKTGIALPALSSTNTTGNYGGIVIVAEVSYDYNGTFASALTNTQWQQLYDYQSTFGVRMVRLDAFPGPIFGTTLAGSNGCCNATGTDQLVSITNSTGFPTAGLKIGATVSTAGLWHYPANITDSATTWPIAKFGPAGEYKSDTVAAVINRFGNGDGTRQQMAWFTGFSTDWSTSSNLLMHSWIHWMTRGLYSGFRRVYFSTQIDDVFLGTELYLPNGTSFRVRAADLAVHVTWMAQVNAKLPAGSNYYIELGHNGNGNIENSTLGDSSGTVCKPKDSIQYDEPDFTANLEWKKPLNTGTNLWPSTAPTSYQWSLACSKLDPLLTWLVTPANLNAYAHVSHTFTHQALNNATFSDTDRQIRFNQAWLNTTGVGAATRFSANGLIPPAITGMHNGDAIKAFLDNGIKHVVGDNTRPVLMNKNNSFWPLTSTVADNGYAGLEIIPRWATTIYYNCDLPNCTLQEWINTSGGSGDFDNLLKDARSVNTRHLLGLHHDPFMFHQANMRQIDAPVVTINGVAARYSLLQAWVEVVIQEMVRLVDWPLITLKHDDIALDFIKRRTRDQCNPQLSWSYSANGKSIVGVTVTATSNTCSVPVPVTFPGPVTSTTGATTEQVGSDPLTLWVTLNGSPATYTLTTPIVL